MNILSKNTHRVLLAAMLCLHFLSAPAQGDDRPHKKRERSPEQSMTETNFRTDGERRPGWRANNDGRGKQRSIEHATTKADFRSEGERRSGFRDEKGDRDRRGSFNEKHSAPGRIPTSADLGSVAPPAHLMRLDTTPEPRKRDSSVSQKDRKRQGGHAVSPRQKSAVHKSGFAARDADRRTDRRDQRRVRDNSRQGYYRPAADHRKPSSQIRHDKGRRTVVKHVVHTIPARHAVILHGRDRYHYHSGRFYRPWNSGFILVRPPIGLIVLNIPLGSRTVFSAGISYHVFGDVYYRRVPAGYQVVEPIRSYAPYRPERVEVVIDLLNLRYGPQTSEAVIAQVDRYTTLRVLGSAPGWLYVEVEGEDLHGWVMERYVAVNTARG
jgi:hypothetical protein